MSENVTPLSWDTIGESSAPAVVLVHSLGADRSQWEPQIEALLPRYRVVRVDLRGHGLSPVSPGPYSLDGLAADVLAVADAAGLERFDYCGVSLGGMIGLLLAARHPARVHKLVAANTAARIGTTERWDERRRAVETEGMSALRDTVVPRWFSPEFATAHPARYERVRQVLAETDPAGYLATCAALRTTDLSALLPRVQAPTLVIGGALDESTPVADSRALHASIRRSVLVVLEDAGHLSNLDRSDAFNRALTAFLRTHAH